MGFILSKVSKSDNVNKNWYLLDAKDARTMKKFWIVVENDPAYYGWIFSGIFFRNHPQYVKYFHDDNIPEFIEDAKIKKKFSAICSLTSVLFINYLKKPNQRDHVLGYIAMIHKDMQLTSQDLENFMMDLLEMLSQERPKLMNNRYRDLIIQYFGGLLRRIEFLMEVYRNNDFRMMEEHKKSQKRICGLKPWCDSPTIYGSSIEFWIAKKQYWQNRLANWAPLEKDLPVLEKDGKAHRMENVKFNVSKGASNLVSRNKKYVVKTTSQARIEMENSESASNDFSQEEVSTRKKDRRYVRHAKLSSTSEPMEMIPEATSSVLINVKSPPRHKISPKNTQAFLDAVEALKITSAHSEADRDSNGSSMKRTSIIDTARERKRARDKKFNAKQHSTSDLTQSMDSRTLITSKAEKFADALAKRRAQ